MISTPEQNASSTVLQYATLDLLTLILTFGRGGCGERGAGRWGKGNYVLQIPEKSTEASLPLGPTQVRLYQLAKIIVEALSQVL